MAHRVFACVSIFLFTVTTLAQTEPSSQPASQPATQTSISPKAKSLLDAMAKAYTDAKSLTIEGKLSLDFDAGGEQKNVSSDFTASFVAPNQFRHEMKDDALIVSTGEKVYAYLPAKNEYVAVEAPKERIAPKDLSEPITQLLVSQDPVLLMAISTDPKEQLTQGASNVAQAEDVKLGEKSFKALTFEKNDRGYRVLLDPSTHLVRQIRIDRKAEIQKRGVEDVKTADVTFDYTSTKVGDAPAPEQFAWSPPRDATVAKEEVSEEAGAAATALEGKPAPDFKLTAIDGSSVSLADLKDHVIVLDFWATWCGPCVASIPHIDQINADLSDKGLKVFAVNLQEAKPLVQKFIVSKKLTLPVLLDTDGATGKKYLANAIPETVIIGKDGLVKKVFVGFGGDEPLRTAIDAEMKK
jgi:thiol-disulfide isomerase/thioredoxin/outer membrane lipoprotein-sorting protein